MAEWGSDTEHVAYTTQYSLNSTSSIYDRDNVVMYHQAASYILSYTFTTAVTYYSSQQLLFNIWFFHTLQIDLFTFGNQLFCTNGHLS